MNNSPKHQDSPQTGGRKEYIYRVAFKEPPVQGSDRREFFYHSLTAIYDEFTPEQVGCKVTRLWNIRVPDGVPYMGRLCTITREPIARKRQKRP